MGRWEIGRAADISRAVRDGIAKSNRVMAPVQWYGGKGNVVRKLIQWLPQGRVYVEPYCGAASMFWHLDSPREVEVLNDLNQEIIGLFRVLQDADLFERLAHRLTWTPYSLDEFRRALADESADPVDRAWAFFVRQNQGFGGMAKTEGNWGRAFVSSRGMAETANRWRGRLRLLDDWHKRLSRVQLDNRDALEIVWYWDSPNTVFYIDPPYVAGTRAKGNTAVYAHECDDAHHRALVDALLGIQGQAMVAGYAHPIYAPLEKAGWERHDIRTACHAAGKVRGSRLRGKGAATKHAARTETVWVKRARVGNAQTVLFGNKAGGEKILSI